MKKLICLSIFALSSLFVTPSEGAVSPVSLAIVPPVQFPPSDFTVAGLRASVLWGKQRDIYGIDIGLLGNITEQDFVGIGISGLMNVTHGTTTVIGLQAAGLSNYNTNKTTVYGIQASLVNLNTADASIVGIQIGAANISKFTTVYGFQVGIYNRAQTVYGFQLGLINQATNLHGIQIGLLNFHEKGVVSISPAINIGF